MTDKKILILSGSSRRNGNTGLMAEAFAKEAITSGNEAVIIELCGKQIYGCLACDNCTVNNGKCIQNDDMSEIAEQLKACDTLVFAAPVYYGGFPAKLKAVIDRFYALGAKNMTVRDCFLLAAAGRRDKTAADSTIHYYEYLADYMGWNNCGEVCAIGYEDKASIKNSDELKRVRELALCNP